MARTKEQGIVGVCDYVKKKYMGKYLVSTNKFGMEIFRIDRVNDAGQGAEYMTGSYANSGDWHPDQAEGHAAVFFAFRDEKRRWYAHSHVVDLSDLVSYRPATEAEIKLFRQVERENEGRAGCECCLVHNARMRTARQKRGGGRK